MTTIGDTPPASPAVGDLWWDSVAGQFYIWFDDGSSSQWVEATNQPGPPGAQGPVGAPGTPGAPGAQGTPGTSFYLGDTPPPSAHSGDGWWDSVKGQLYIFYDDGTSSQWVPSVNQIGASGPPGPRGLPGPPGPQGPAGPATGGGGGGGSGGSNGGGGSGFNSGMPICDLPGYLSPEPNVDRLFDNIGAIIPGLTTEVLSMVIWNTIEDFYMTSTYRREHIYWRLDPGVLTMSFDPYDQEWRVSRFLGFSGLDRVKFEPPGRIRDLTSPAPTTTRNGEILLSLKPRSINTCLPYDMWTTYFDALYNGALARLYMQPAKPYGDMKAAQLCTSLYRKGVAGARAEAQAAHIREGSSWSFPYFAAGGYPSGRGGGHFPGRW